MGNPHIYFSEKLKIVESTNAGLSTTRGLQDRRKLFFGGGSEVDMRSISQYRNPPEKKWKTAFYQFPMANFTFLFFEGYKFVGVSLKGPKHPMGRRKLVSSKMGLVFPSFLAKNKHVKFLKLYFALKAKALV